MACGGRIRVVEQEIGRLQPFERRDRPRSATVRMRKPNEALAPSRRSSTTGRPRRLRLFRDERGNALVEFALVAPLLFLILFGVLDFGKAFNYWSDENHLAAQGARLAAVNNATPGNCPDGSTPTSLQAYIKCNADTSELLSNARVCISFPKGTPVKTGDPVSVNVSTNYTWIPLVGSVFGSTSTPIAGSATMRIEADGSSLSYSAGCV
jgi:hypothetical protein